MPMYNKTEMAQNASLYGFQRDTFEKVLRLINILNYIQEESVLNEHLILKGGTGINLTVFDLPRLSVDIDLDYIPNDNRDDMLANREIITTKLIRIEQNKTSAGNLRHQRFITLNFRLRCSA